jgi:integrase
MGQTEYFKTGTTGVYRRDGVRGPTYRIVVKGPDGKRHPQTFATLRAAERALRATRTAIDQDAYVEPSKATLEEVYAKFLASRPNMKPATRAGYVGQFRRYVLPALGSRRVRSFTTAQLMDFYSKLRAEGCNEPTVRSVHRYLSSVLKWAAKRGEITSNPATGAYEAPDVDTAVEGDLYRALTEDEVKLIASKMPERYVAPTLLMGYLGFRPEECFGLRAKDVDLDDGWIHVRQASREVEGVQSFGPPKTGPRDVSIPEALVPILRRHAELYPSVGLGLFFSAEHGGPLRQGNYRSRIFQPAVKAAGIESTWTPYDLRKTAVSMLLAHGVTPFETARLTGTSVRLVDAVYGHLFSTAVKTSLEGYGAGIGASS